MESADTRVSPTKDGTQGFLKTQDNGFDFNLPVHSSLLHFKIFWSCGEVSGQHLFHLGYQTMPMPFVLPRSKPAGNVDYPVDPTRCSNAGHSKSCPFSKLDHICCVPYPGVFYHPRQSHNASPSMLCTCDPVHLLSSVSLHSACFITLFPHWQRSGCTSSYLDTALSPLGPGFPASYSQPEKTFPCLDLSLLLLNSS